MNLGSIIQKYPDDIKSAFLKKVAEAEDSKDITIIETFITESMNDYEDEKDFETFKKLVLETIKIEKEEEKKEEIEENNKSEEEMKKFEQGYDDCLNESINLDEMLGSEDYRKGVAKAKDESNEPKKVLKESLDSMKNEFKALFEEKFDALKEELTKENKDEVTVKDVIKLGLYEGRRGNTEASFEDDDENLVESFKGGLEQGLEFHEKRVKPLKELAEKCNVKIDEFIDLVLKEDYNEAFETVLAPINESEDEVSDELMEKLVWFANLNGSDIALQEKKSKKNEADDEDDEDDEDEDDPKDKKEEKKKMKEAIDKLQKEMDDEEDEDKKKAFGKKIKEMMKEMAGEDDDEYKKNKKLPKDIEEAIVDMKKDKTITEQASIDESVGSLEFEDEDELREQIVELGNLLTEDDEEDDSKKSRIANRYKRYGK